VPAPVRTGAESSYAANRRKRHGGLPRRGLGFGWPHLHAVCVFPMIRDHDVLLPEQPVRRAPGEREHRAGVDLLPSASCVPGLRPRDSHHGRLLGPFGIVTLGSNPWVKRSFSYSVHRLRNEPPRAFEITLPSSIMNPLKQVGRPGRILGRLLMGALTFSLSVSPAWNVCRHAAGGVRLRGKTRPLIRHGHVATGLRGPFFLLASSRVISNACAANGGWMARVQR